MDGPEDEHLVGSGRLEDFGDRSSATDIANLIIGQADEFTRKLFYLCCRFSSSSLRDAIPACQYSREIDSN